MKIKLAILEKDTGYLDRIVSVFETKYSDKFELYSFTDPAFALSNLDNAKIDILVSNDVFDIDVSKLPKRCGFAYFVDSVGIEMKNDQRAICKFQKVDLIYKQILSIYSEKAESISGLKFGDDNTKIILFHSVSGGAGASSMAAAAALHFAAQNKKTLYLNLEKFGASDVFFLAEGKFNMSDIIYALKSKKANLSLKLESCVKQDRKGVYFYSQAKIALDMLELTCDEKIRLISELRITGSYEYIILDSDFGIDRESLKIAQQAHAVVWVGDGSEISNHKVIRAYEALKTIEKNAESEVNNRICLIYNKFSNKTGKVISEIAATNVGGAPRYEHATTEQIINQLSSMEMFDRII